MPFCEISRVNDRGTTGTTLVNVVELFRKESQSKASKTVAVSKASTSVCSNAIILPFRNKPSFPSHDSWEYKKGLQEVCEKVHASNTWSLFPPRFEVDDSRHGDPRVRIDRYRAVVPRSDYFPLGRALGKLFLARSFHLNVFKQPISRHESSKKNTKLWQGRLFVSINGSCFLLSSTCSLCSHRSTSTLDRKRVILWCDNSVVIQQKSCIVNPLSSHRKVNFVL